MNALSTSNLKKILPIVFLIAVMSCATILSEKNSNQSIAAGKSIAFQANKTYQAECASCQP
jgi:hypothetical protein